MAEESILESINQVNTEAVPRAMITASRFEESLSDVTNKMQSFKREADTQLESYRRDLNEQLTAAELKLEDTERKLEVLMQRLSGDIEQRAGEVIDSTTQRKELLGDFVSQSESIDKEVDSFGNDLESFGSNVEGIANEISASVGSYQETTDALHQQLTDTFEGYRESHSAAAKEIAESLSEGTTAVIDKMSNLKGNIEGKLGEYEGLYGEVISLLTEQTVGEAEGFSEALDFAEQTVGGLSEVFDGSIGEIADKLEEISGLIDSIKPVLDFIDGLT